MNYKKALAGLALAGGLVAGGHYLLAPRSEQRPTLEKKAPTLEELTNVSGNLLDSFLQLEPDSIRHSYEIMNERRTNASLRDSRQWTADFPMYRLENEKGEQDANGEAVLYFAPIKHNLVFRHLEDAMDDSHPVIQLRTTHNYKPNAKEVREVVDSAKTKETLRVKLADLNLERYDDEWSFFEIDTDNYANSVKQGGLNAVQRELAERAYGQGQDFVENMAMLSQSGKQKTTFYVLNPEYVKANARKDAICRFSWLNNFYFNSNFIAYFRYADLNLGGLRGVLRRKVAEDGEKK